jgi:hypothetical protein
MSVGMQAAATGAVGANPTNSTPHARGRAAMQSWGEEAADRASAAGESADARFVQQPDGSVLNRATVSKWGLKIGEVTLKISPRPAKASPLPRAPLS